MALDMNYDPPKHLNLLTTLDEAGQSEYPGLVALAYFPVTSVEERMAVAMKAYQSLVIRLLVRRPLRTRHVCDVQFALRERVSGDSVSHGRNGDRVSSSAANLLSDACPRRSRITVWRSS